MRACWQLVPADRPNISSLCASLDALLSVDTDYLDLLDANETSSCATKLTVPTSVPTQPRAEANGYVDVRDHSKQHETTYPLLMNHPSA